MNIDIPEKVQKYTESHKLDTSFLKDVLNWTWDPTAINIPIYDQFSNFLYFKHRHLDFEERKAAGDKDAKKFSFDHGTHPRLYGLHLVKDSTQIILCEGEPDCAQLWQNNIPAVTSTGGVTKFDQQMAKSLIGKEILVCLDTDKAGQGQIRRISKLIQSEGIPVKIICIPEEFKDVCEFFGGVTNPCKEFLKLKDEALTLDDWWRVNKPEDFRTITGNELLNTEFPASRWLINNILPQEGLVILFAAEGSYKSFISLDLALCVASGKSWLGQDKFRVDHQGKVLIIDKENPLEMIKRRINGLGFDQETSRNIRWVMYSHKLQLLDEKNRLSEFMCSLSEEVVDEGIDLIVIDSFVDLMVGNENSAEDTQAFVASIHELFPKKCILTLNHENKPSQGAYRNDAQRNRGSSNLNAQASTMFRLELTSTEGNELTIKQTKARDSQKLDKFLVEVKKGTAEDGSTYVSGFGYKGVFVQKEEKADECETTIKDMFVENNVISRTEILSMCNNQGISRSVVDRVISQLSKDGVISSIVNQTDRRKSNYILATTLKTQND